MREAVPGRPRRLTPLACFFALVSLVYMAVAWQGPIVPIALGWVAPALCSLVGVIATIRILRTVPLERSARRFWAVLAIAVTDILVGMISQLIDIMRASPMNRGQLSLHTMAFDLSGLALVLLALLTVPVGRLSRATWFTFGLDAGTVLAGSAVFTWYFTIRSASSFFDATGSNLPLLAILGAAFLGVLALLKISFAGVREVDARALQLLAVAALAGASTAALTPLLADRPQLNVSMLAYPAAYTFLTAGAERQRQAALGLSAEPKPRAPRTRFRGLRLLPYAAVALVDILLLACMDPHDSRLLIGGVVLVTALVVGRQLVSMRENSRLLGQLDSTVGELRASENRLTFQATHDALTGLANRALLAKEIDTALEGPYGPADLAMALIDLDDFKQVNDRLGHNVGDTLLVAAAARIRASIGPDDLVARLGGDEFAVLFRGLGGNPELPAQRIERILEALAAPLQIAGDELKIRASVGLADGWAGGDFSDLRRAADATELSRRADVAMYAAKGRQEGGWARYTVAMDAPAADQARLAHGLRDGLGRGDFRLVYQPIVTLPAQKISGVEALIRWHDPERGVIPPDRFIPVAERNGLIVPLGRWVLREACKQAARWVAEYGIAAPGRVSVNVSPRQLNEPDFVSDVVTALADTGLPASSLVIEVTETTVFDGGAEAIAALDALRALGVRIALDDFGTGQSSLGLLLSCPVDILKVDKSFVDGVTEPGDRAVIVQFLSQVAHGLNLDTVAEGVESEAQARRLHELGYRKGQGYLFSRPLPADELAAQFTRPTPAVLTV